MRKIHGCKGGACLTIGIVLLALALMFQWPGQSYLCGLAGGLIGAGGGMLLRNLYWRLPKNREKYAEKQHEQQIDLKDERKIMLRDKSGRIAYQITIYMYCLLIVIASVFNVAEICMPFAHYAVIALTLLLIFQYITGIIVYRVLVKRL